MAITKKPGASPAVVTAPDLLGALRGLQESLRITNEQISRLVAAIEGNPDPGLSGGPKKGSINWVIGPPDNLGWAYGNNAKRLASKLTRYEHRISSEEPSDVAIYFDALVADRFPVKSKRSILRIGGPRPLDRLYGEDVEALRKGLSRFDAVVALSGDLHLRAMQAHPNVHLIPNALDLKKWKGMRPNFQREFTVGFAASVKSKTEADVKGQALAIAAAERLGARLVMTTKGANQIPHDRMYEDFYSKVDALIHPVAAGREGTSNVLMEAIAAGIPVVTTPFAGFHGEFLVDRKSAMICGRDEYEITDALAELSRDPVLRRRLSREGRLFAERNHDLDRAAEFYRRMIAGVMSGKTGAAKLPKRKIAFLPFWEPAEEFGSSRLRAKYPAEYLAKTPGYDIVMGYQDDADIVIVVQMCSDDILAKLNANRKQFVIYDVCDKYYENPRLFKHLDPPVDSLGRFGELVERADLVIVPSLELKAEVASRATERPVRYVPEPVDYDVTPQAPSLLAEKNKIVLWFGNPDRGNFESAKWMLDHLQAQHGYQPLIISRPSFFKKYPEYQPFVEQWSIEAMKAGFTRADLCVLGYDAAEQAKSANRFVSAIVHGVPTLVSGSPAVLEILRKGDHLFASVGSVRELDRAMRKLQGEDFRQLFMKRVQRNVMAEHGRDAVTLAYQALLDRQTFAPAAFERPRNVAFVTHNLALGEGAPWSLLELVKGLREKGVAPFVFSGGDGPLAAAYAEAGIPLTIFNPTASHIVKVLNGQFVETKDAFISFLQQNKIEAVFANTAKSAPMADFASEIGIKSAIIVRESYAADQRFSYFTGDARLTAVRGLTMAEQIVFVAHTSRAMWSDQPFRGDVSVVPNGILPTRFGEEGDWSRADFRRSLGIADDDIVAICVGTINLRKGQGELVQAFAELPAEVRGRARLLILGATENSHVADFRAMVAALPEEIQERVIVVDATTEVTPYYRASDFFLMNSNSEAYPRSVVEALLFGLPVLSTPVFGVREQIVPNVSGLLYEFNDMDAWKECFTELVTDDAKRSTMALEAARAFWKLTTYQESLIAYKSILAKLLPA